MNKREQIQQEALDKAIPLRKAGLAVSMGVGKTLIGLRYLDYFYQQGGRRFLVVAPKLSIIQSWKDDAEKFELIHLLKEIEFTTYLSLNKKQDRYSVVVLDECHSLLGSHLGWLSGHRGRILGLTGTPPRYSQSEKGQLVEQFCPIVYKYITDDAVSDKILNDYRIKVHLIPLSKNNDLPVKTKTGGTFFTSEVKNYEYWTKRLAGAQTKKEEQVASVMRMRAMMDFRSKEVYAQNLLAEITDKCIVFANTQDQADRLCAYSYHSSNVDAEKFLDWFKKGRIIQLSSVLQLNEGVTIPGLKEGIILHAYGNERKSNQRIGRLLRLNPEDTATIHILCYADTVDQNRWLPAAIADLDPEKIEYVDATKPNPYEILLR